MKYYGNTDLQVSNMEFWKQYIECVKNVKM